jgi:hypothetical protein
MKKFPKEKRAASRSTKGVKNVAGAHHRFVAADVLPLVSPVHAVGRDTLSALQ